MIIYENATEVFLAHHGVKGMRWGVRNQRKKYKQYKRQMYGDKKRKPLTQAQKDMRKIRTVGRISIGIYLARTGAEFLLTPQGQKLMNTSAKKYQRVFHPTVEDKIRKYIREGPPPASFIDVKRVDGLIPFKGH